MILRCCCYLVTWRKSMYSWCTISRLLISVRVVFRFLSVFFTKHPCRCFSPLRLIQGATCVRVGYSAAAVMIVVMVVEEVHRLYQQPFLGDHIFETIDENRPKQTRKKKIKTMLFGGFITGAIENDPRLGKAKYLSLTRGEEPPREGSSLPCPQPPCRTINFPRGILTVFPTQPCHATCRAVRSFSRLL